MWGLKTIHVNDTTEKLLNNINEIKPLIYFIYSIHIFYTISRYMPVILL